MKVGQWVLHVDTGVVGRIKHLHQKEAYISPINGQPVRDAVVELEGGNALLLESQWLQLSDQEVVYLQWFNSVLRGLIQQGAARAAVSSLRPHVAAGSMRFVLERQARALPVHPGDPGIPVG